MNEDRFGDALDAIVTDAEMLDPDPLATFALALQAAEGAPATDRLDADRRASIWRTLMTDHAHHHPKSGGPGPLSQPAMAMPTNPWTPRPGSVTRRSGIMPFASRVQTAFTAFAVLAIILAAWTGFAAFRESGGPSVTPTAFAHGAASATPSASTAAENEWLTWVQPEECNVAPLSESELATIMSTSESTSAHMYSPLTIPDAEDAREVARTARTILACGVEVPSVLMTSHYIAEIERLVNDTDYLETQRALYIARGKQISEAYRESVPADFVLLSPVEPSVGALGYAYLPQKSVQFPDGRIGVPRAMLFWEGVGNPTQEEIDSMPYFLAELLIFVHDSSMWKLDERLTFCVGDCDAAWEWAANPEGPAPWSTPVASPVASPISTPMATPVN